MLGSLIFLILKSLEMSLISDISAGQRSCPKQSFDERSSSADLELCSKSNTIISLKFLTLNYSISLDCIHLMISKILNLIIIL